MEAATTATRRSGRPREFEVDDALDRAIEVFREFGYEAASMTCLERATGLNKSSIYNTFGSKEALFQRSLDRYKTTRLATIDEILVDGTDGLADLHRALDIQQAESQSEWGAQGCLAVNAMTEFGPRATNPDVLGGEFRSALAESIRKPLQRAVALNEIEASDVPRAVALLLSLTLALGVLMRGGASLSELAAHFGASHAAIESWRIDH